MPDGVNLPAEIARRQRLLEAVAAAKARGAEGAKVCFEKEQAESEAKLLHREQKTNESGRKPGGKPPVADTKPQDQLNFTDEQSRIMPVAGGTLYRAGGCNARPGHGTS